MKNISVTQFVIVLFVGILLFSDLSKIIKRLQHLLEKKKVYKNAKRK